MSTGLVLSGGGARAAYQVGVLKAVVEILGQPEKNPFPVISGSSAGAINSSVVACESDRFSEAIPKLEAVWRGLTSTDVHELGGMAIAGALFSLGRSVFHDGYSTGKPWSLLDNSPLRELLQQAVRIGRLSEILQQGHLSAISITALGYTSGDTISFYQSHHDIPIWKRHRRIGSRAQLRHDHLMASTAIPGIYPAVKINREYFGDGSVRQTAPLSSALHLGAKKLFVIGVSHNPVVTEQERQKTVHTPSLAQMTSHFFNSGFIDALEQDMERLQRLNNLLQRLPEDELEKVEFREVDVLSITPSRAFDKIAIEHLDTLPRSMRFLFKRLGATGQGGGTSLASYLMFETPFISELIELGYQDAMDKREEISVFLS